MAKEQAIVLTGIVKKCLPNEQFTVVFEGRMTPCIATLAGKLKVHKIRVLQGDHVDVEMNACDLTKGRITMRHKNHGRQNPTTPHPMTTP